MMVLVLVYLLVLSVAEGFLLSPTAFAPRCIALKAEESDLGQQAVSLLGNIAAAVSKKAKAELDKLSEREELGELANWVDEQTRAVASELTKKEKADFGDLKDWVNGRLKELGTEEWIESRINELKANEDVKKLIENLKELGSSEDVTRQLEAVIGKETTEKLREMVEGDEIQLGEISKTVGNEILALVKSRDYNVSDYILLFKILSAVGLSLNPIIISALPLNLLLQLYNVSLVQEVSNHITGALALEIDSRAKKAFAVELEKKTKKALTGDPDADVGEVFKKTVLEYIGKDVYDFGDITRMLKGALEEDSETDPKELTIGAVESSEEALVPELMADTELLQEALVVEAEVVEEATGPEPETTA